MVVYVSNSFNHSVPKSKPKPIKNEKELEQKLIEKIEELGVPKNEIKRNENGELELSHLNNLKLHTICLEMEKLGLDIKMTKNTIIEIC